MAMKTKKNPAAVALGRLGGLRGGQARAKMLTAASGFRTTGAQETTDSQFRVKVRVPSMPSIEMVAVVAVISRH